MDELAARERLSFILPDWPAPANVRAAVTTRSGGVSRPPYDGLNLGDHVGDIPEAVTENRRLLGKALALPAEPFWLRQVHGTTVVPATATGREADAVLARAPGEVCAVLTADCLPVLLCDRAGTVVAAVHAGWRGLAAGIIEKSVAAMKRPPDQVLAWMGPAIGAAVYEVGDEVRDAFVPPDPGAASAFVPSPAGRWFADLYALARRRLARAGVREVSGGNFCTFSEAERFYSYRRDGVTGRMASLVWRV